MLRARKAAVALSAMVWVGVTPAEAQDTGGSGWTETTPGTQAAPAAPASTAAPASPAPAPEPTAAPTEPAPQEPEGDRLDHGRFRIGLEVGGGYAWGETKGAAVGLLGQLGVQLNNTIGIYYQPSLYFMGFGDPNTTAARGIVGTGQGGMVVFDLSRFFEIGAGGGYFYGQVGDCSASDPNCDAGSFHGAIVTARAAFVIGFNLVRARIGIPISVNSQTVFNGNQRVTTLIAAIGLQRY